MHTYIYSYICRWLSKRLEEASRTGSTSAQSEAPQPEADDHNGAAKKARSEAGGQDGVGAEWMEEENGAGWEGETLPAIGQPLASNVHKDLRELHDMLEDNLKFFVSSPEQTLRHYKRCSEVCVSTILTLQDVAPLVQGVATVAAMHDVSRNVQGNGYWSQLRVLSCCLKKMKKKLVSIKSERESVFFGTRVKSLLHGLTSYHRILVILKALLHTTLVFRRDELLRDAPEVHAELGLCVAASAAAAAALEPGCAGGAEPWGSAVGQ